MNFINPLKKISICNIELANLYDRCNLYDGNKEGEFTMIRKRSLLLCATAAVVSGSLSIGPARAQAEATDSATASDASLGDIVVTAQKREENINKVPMSITAATAQQLRNAGVTEIRDLVKITPGLTYADSTTGTPVYTIRGVGFSDFALAGRPTVTVYTDQAPIPFSIETRGVALDLERVEVLKGPQGTLFGTNSTGGAINFIAAKPTTELKFGGDLSYGRFNSTQVSAFVSGPISSTLTARVAVEHDGMDAWQVNYLNGDKNGVQDFWNGRLTLAWAPTDQLKASLTVNRWIDHSDTQAQQFIAYANNVPVPVPELASLPTAPANNRAAGWDAGRNYRKDNNFLQTNLRLDYELADAMTVTSLTSYSRYREDQLSDLDGTTVSNNYQQTLGKIRSISQELRLAGRFLQNVRYTIGGSYSDDKSTELDPTFSPVASISNALGVPVNFVTKTNQSSVTKAVFASFDYDVTPDINVYAGGRYTDFRTNFHGCAADTGDGFIGSVFGVQPGECFTPTATGAPGIVNTILRQNNFSWRAGAQWTVAPRIMLYANLSKGYKAGSFPVLPATSFHQFDPVDQESVLAYEAGFKAALFDRAVQLNGAVFHYDYTNKQILGYASVIINGGAVQVLRLINIPKSRINGAEIEITTAPVEGLKISAAGTYVSTRITSPFVGIDPLGATADFEGGRFPNTPKWQFSSDAEYKWAVNESVNAFLGGNLRYQSATNSGFGNVALFSTKEYALLDLRAGIESGDGKWRASLWGRNVTNTYYWTAAAHAQDAVVRFAGMPVTYGTSINFRF
jgi:iron complex outermembrane recepter protein